MNKGIKIHGLEDRMREIIHDSGLSVTAFAHKCGIARSRFYDAHTLRLVFKVCSTFHVSADWLLFGRGNKYTREAPHNEHL